MHKKCFPHFHCGVAISLVGNQEPTTTDYSWVVVLQTLNAYMYTGHTKPEKDFQPLIEFTYCYHFLISIQQSCTMSIRLICCQHYMNKDLHCLSFGRLLPIFSFVATKQKIGNRQQRYTDSIQLADENRQFQAFIEDLSHHFFALRLCSVQKT